MHEMAIAHNIMEIIETKLAGLSQKGKIAKVNLKVGKLTCVEPEALRLSFQAISRQTPLEKASLFIDSVPVTAKCKECGKNLHLEKMDFTCPFCGSFRIDVITGRELFIESFEIE